MLVALVALGAGCARRQTSPADEQDAGPPVRGGTLEIVGFSDLDHFSTISAYVTTSLMVSRTFARQLVTYLPGPDLSREPEPVADLAAEVPTLANRGISPDGLEYTFRLRRGVRWDSDPPREVTAHDVVRAFELFCNPISPVGAAGYYTETIAGMVPYCEELGQVPGEVSAIRSFVETHEIEGVRALDDFTVRFRLLHPATDFLNLVAMPFASPIPVEYLDYLPDGPDFRQHMLSDGPYRMARYVQNREMVLERNPTWDADSDPVRSAWVDRIHVRLGIDEQLQQLQIEAGTADLGTETVRSADLGPLLAIDDPTVWLSPTGEAYGQYDYVMFNHVGPNNGGALKRLEVRRAIARAIDRPAIVQLFGGPRVARPLHQAVLSSASGYDPEAEPAGASQDRGDAEAARRQLAAAGFPDGLTLRLAYQSVGSYPLIAQALQASLERAGVHVELLPTTTSEFYARLMADPEIARRGDWDLVVNGWLPDWFGRNGRSVIPPLFDGRHLGQNTQNFGRYSNPEVDAAIDRATVASTAELAEQAWREAAHLLLEDAALVPLIERKLAWSRSRRVRNCQWSILGSNCDLTAVWLADAARSRGAS